MTAPWHHMDDEYADYRQDWRAGVALCALLGGVFLGGAILGGILTWVVVR